MQGRPQNSDPRVRHTRDAVIGALVHLAFERRYDAIRVADLIAAAGVGRATFYEHFHSKDDVLLAAMEPILVPLANAASGRAAKDHVRMMLTHIWEKRAIGRIILDSRASARIHRALAAMIEDRANRGENGEGSISIEAAGAAAAQLAMLRHWVAGGAPCSPDVLADRMMRCLVLLQRTT
ncbi:TetR family transcriptional regulator [Hephaestia caeni]|uniref:TetR family transcriptional regulator n=1 Tax=Hephaestia caeni TaxID=645617 RepID=A0A397PAV0_9SPHN|nr:TetR/AcrR family transcriptional regulator [Hephaestia caeni]RIA46088.1 TetR family transcriptional regulator [Hephaestia caeni]